MKSQTRIIIINQTVNPAFTAWVEEFAQTYGQLELWSGNAPTNLSKEIVVRSAPIYDRTTGLSRLRTWLLFTVVVTWWLWRRWDRVPVFAVTNPPSMPLIVWLFYRLQKRPYALLEWDIYPNILTAMGMVRPQSLVYKLWQQWHSRALRDARLIVTIGEHMAAQLRRLARKPELPLSVIPNWVDTDWLHPVSLSDNSFAHAHNLQDKLVVLYSGNLGATHAIETITETAKHLQDRNDIIFLIIGDGAKRAVVEAAVNAGSRNIRLLPWQPTDQLPLTLGSAHIGIVTLAQGYEALSVPSKTYALLAVGAAILGISNPPNDLALTIEQFHCGANFKSDESETIARWIRNLADDRTALKRYKLAARDAARQHFTHEVCAHHLTKLTSQALLAPS